MGAKAQKSHQGALLLMGKSGWWQRHLERLMKSPGKMEQVQWMKIKGTENQSQLGKGI